ncbi:MAG TPA: hypothetical protein DEA88_07310, partial [Erwinia persicina]|nr:hypothetical protein [Erwinia persicina]
MHPWQKISCRSDLHRTTIALHGGKMQTWHLDKLRNSAQADGHGVITMSDIDLYTSSPLFRIRGDIVTTVKDDHGEVIVIDNKTFRIMSFDRIFEQSKMQKNHSALPVHFYIRAMLMAVALTPAKRVLLLGLGGGSLVRALFARNPDIVIDVVELRHAVLAVAQDYFHLPVSEHIHYQVA